MTNIHDNSIIAKLDLRPDLKTNLPISCLLDGYESHKRKIPINLYLGVFLNNQFVALKSGSKISPIEH